MACEQFGLSMFDMTEDNFLRNDSFDVFTFGRSPVSIDIMKKVKGCEFEPAYSDSQFVIENALSVRYINLAMLMDAKKASGRQKDLDVLKN